MIDANSTHADGPLSVSAFHGLMSAALRGAALPARLAVACSGGPDSMALTALLTEWCAEAGVSLTALIVDHRLRAEAAAEAAQVRDWLAERDVTAEILTWRGDRPAANLQAEARAARYTLMLDWCRRHGTPALALAHHRDDQAETVLLRLARGSGVDGLAGMAPRSERDGVMLLRPLLAIGRARLHAVLADRAWPYVSDPSNDDVSFARVRMRRLLPALAREGIDAARLAGTATAMARARNALATAAEALLADAAAVAPDGYVLVAGERLQQAPDDLALRALAKVLMAVGGQTYPPRLERLERLLDAIRREGLEGGRTLAGCRIAPYGDRVLVAREAAAVQEVATLVGGRREEAFWDRRFRLRFADAPRGATVRRLGRNGWTALRKIAPDAGLDAIPGPVRPTLPALWLGDRLAAAPSLDLFDASICPASPVRCDFLPASAWWATPFHRAAETPSTESSALDGLC